MIFKNSIFIIPFFIISLYHVAYSQTLYRWIDDKDTIHFTTHYENIPLGYRNLVQKQEGVDKADTTSEAQRREKNIGSPVISPIEEQAEILADASTFQQEGNIRKAERETRVKVELEGRYWITDFTAEAKVTESGIGTDIDLKDDLGLKDEDLPDVRFTWNTGPKSKLRLAYSQVAYSGDETIERTIEFAGETYTVGTRVITDFDVKYLRLGWAWQFINIANGRVKLGTLLEAKGALIDISLDAPYLIPPIKESERFIGGLPTVGAALDINPHKLVNIFAEVSGIYAGKYGYFLDGEAGIKIIPIKYVSILGGYRILDFQVEDDPDLAQLRISGPFVGITLRF